MYIVRTPFRVSFLGGGTDISWFYERNGGAVLSTSINRYMYLSGHPMFDSNETLLKYSKTELVSDVSQLDHPIARTILSMEQINGYDISVSADIPSGSGLGSSSAFTVALGHLAARIKNSWPTKAELAELACEVEINRLSEPIGKQDQYASSFGGVNSIVFSPDGSTDVTPLSLDHAAVAWLESSLVLVRVGGGTRSASELLLQQKEEAFGDAKKFESLEKLHELTMEATTEVQKDITSLSEYLQRGWELKKASSKSATSVEIDELISYGLGNGALGAKMLGAGKSGFVLFLVDPIQRQEFESKFEVGKIHSVKPEYFGSTLIHDDET